MINWFPGHMAKSLKKISDLQRIDLVIEVVDARAINISQAIEIDKLNNIPKIIVALKSDMASVEKIQQKNEIVSNIYDRQLKTKIIKKLYEILGDKIEKNKKLGIVQSKFYIIVVGLPNIGKSSLINVLANSKLNKQNKPGVTKSNQLVKLNENFYIYDTPGIMIKKISKSSDGYKLALINVIKKEILPLNEVINFAFNFYKKKYNTSFSQMFGLNITNLSYEEFIHEICQKYKFITLKEQNDTERCLNFLFKKFTSNLTFKVNYEE